MFQTFRNAWKIPELKNRLLFTLAILVVYRLGCAIPVPFVSGSALTQMFANGDMLSYLNMMSGGALARCTLFALGVTPYINASIIVQLLTVAIPALENLAKEADGQQKLQQINRYAGAVVALIMSIGYYFVIRNMGALKYVSGGAGIFAAIVIIATFVAGAQLITWCGEQIDDKGIGNGVSLIIFASIVSNWSSLYTSVKGLLTQAASGKPQYYFFLPLLIVLALVAVVFVVVMTNAERRITIQYAKRVVGRKQMGGQNSYLPLKLNMSGVMPIIFASALVSIPGTIGSFLQIDQQAHPVWYAFFTRRNLAETFFRFLVVTFGIKDIGRVEINLVAVLTVAAETFKAHFRPFIITVFQTAERAAVNQVGGFRLAEHLCRQTVVLDIRLFIVALEEIIVAYRHPHLETMDRSRIGFQIGPQCLHTVLVAAFVLGHGDIVVHILNCQFGNGLAFSLLQLVDAARIVLIVVHLYASGNIPFRISIVQLSLPGNGHRRSQTQ